MAENFHCGQRLSYDNHLCTVRYVGDVASTKGSWLGVEWDDPARGKHSGEHQNTRYFTCKSKQSAPASFVRPTRPHDPPRQLVEALRIKYAPEIHDLELLQAVPEAAIQISGKEVEEVGFDKIRSQLANFQELRVVLLDRLWIIRPKLNLPWTERWVFSSSDVQKTCPKVYELDLSHNLFEDISEIIDVCLQLPRLKSLKINGNRFGSISQPLSTVLDLQAPLNYLRSLELDDTLLTWQEVTNICSTLPMLERLSVSGNEYSSIPSCDANNFARLNELVLERNQFHSVADVAELSVISTLTRLGLKLNSISEAGNDVRRFGRSLISVDLSYNAIADFLTVSNLSIPFPDITSLRISHNTVLLTGTSTTTGLPLTMEDTFMLTVARLGTLQTLNFSTVSSKDRHNAETYYMSQIAAELGKAPAEARGEVLAKHPRYNALTEVYGERTGDVSSSQASHNLAARLASITFKLDDSVWRDASMTQGQSISRQWTTDVPLSFSIYAMLGVIGKTLKLPPMLLRLIWETGEEEAVPEDEDILTKVESMLEDDSVLTTETKPRRRLREDELIPRMRSLDTWIETPTAMIRVEWSEQEKTRFDQLA